MPAPPSPRSVRAYRRLLGALPARFRIRYGGAMEESFADGLAQLKTPFARFRFTARNYLGVVRTSLVERLVPSLPETPARAGKQNMFGSTISNLTGDVRHALRSLRRQPGFAFVAVLTIALAVGANTAIFSVVKGVLLEPLPFNDPDRLIRVGAYDISSEPSLGSMSAPDITDIAGLESVRTMVGYRTGTIALTGDGQATIIALTRVTEGLMETFGVTPFMGRDLRRDENASNAPSTAVISYSFWQNRMNADPEVLGKIIQLAERDWEVVGVAPPGFEGPEPTDVWQSFRLNPEECARGCHIARAIGILAQGFTVENARAEMSVLASSLSDQFPDTNFEKGFAVRSLKDDVVGDFRTGLLVVLSAVGVVLLIACTNVAILLMVRSSARESEMAVRAALGAGRKRLLIQMLMESQVLALAGAAVGLGIAYGAVEALKLYSAGTVPRLETVAIDETVLLFTLLSSFVVALLFGMAPAVTLSRSGISSGLLTGGRSALGRRGENRLRSVLLTAEVAMSLVLLAGSGLLLKTFQNIYEIDLGYETHRIVRFSLSLPSSRYDTLDRVTGFYDELERRIEGIPGVESVGSVYGAPLGRGNITGEVQVDGRPLPEPGAETYGSIKSATPGYLSTMRIPVLRGRPLRLTDRTDAHPVALVNETFVRENFPTEDPIGQRVYITASFGWAEPTWEIVGVVQDVRTRAMTEEPVAEIYVPQAQFGPPFMSVTVRATAVTPALTSSIREIISDMDASLPARQFETMEDAIGRQTAPTKFYLMLIGAFAGLAVVLAAVGLYGVVGYLVARRIRELGIRLALGANRGHIVRLMMFQGLGPAVAGIVVGLGGAWAGSRLLQSLLYDVAPRDPTVLGAVSLLLLGVSTVAIFLPARRAAGVDPVDVMKAE